MIKEGLGALKKKIAKILREYKALDRARTCGAQCVTVVRSRKEVQIDVDGTVTAVLAAAEDYCRVCGHEKAELTRLYFFERKTEVAVAQHAEEDEKRSDGGYPAACRGGGSISLRGNFKRIQKKKGRLIFDFFLSP